MGYDRALFSVDYLYENADIAGRFLDSAVIETETKKVARLNAMEVMRLGL